MATFPNPFWPSPSAPKQEASSETSVVLIATFVVPASMEDGFLQWWRVLKPYFAAQPGFVSARLHRSLDQNQQYRFINIAEWRSSDAYRQALSSMWSTVPKPSIPGFEWHPALYEVIEET